MSERTPADEWAVLQVKARLLVEEALGRAERVETEYFQHEAQAIIDTATMRNLLGVPILAVFLGLTYLVVDGLELSRSWAVYVAFIIGFIPADLVWRAMRDWLVRRRMNALRKTLLADLRAPPKNRGKNWVNPGRPGARGTSAVAPYRPPP